MGILKNKVLLVVYLVDILLVSLLFLIPPLGALFQLSYVAPLDWLLVVALSSTVFIVEEVRKRIARRL